MKARVGPVAPTRSATVVQRPAENVRLTGGLLGKWQYVNRTASLPHAIAKLEEAGNLDNLRLAAGDASRRGHTEYRGPAYMDSDVHKVVESLAWELAHHDDPALRDFVHQATELVGRAQCDDGYVNSYCQVLRPDERFVHLEGSHEHYTAGHLMQAAIAVHRSVGTDALLDIACRNADHLVKVFLDEGFDRLDGHPGVETALVELFRETGNTRYLDLAAKMVDDRGYGKVGKGRRGPAYFQDHMPVRAMRSVVGHVVRGLYLEAGIVDVACETGDADLLSSSITRWQDMVATRTAITGGLGARQLGEAFGERYEIPPDQSYNETCAALASIHWSWRLLLATGEAAYAELIERTLYNAFAASVSVDGRQYFKGVPLQRRPDHAEAVGDPRTRDAWFWSACCPPNVTRLMASLEHYLVTHTDDAVYLQQFANAAVQVKLEHGTVELDVETDYPWDGAVTIRVRQSPERAWTLGLRIPTWARSAELVVAGETRQIAGSEPGYVMMRRTWRSGDTVTLRLDLTARLTRPHHRIDALRGCVAIERGPLVYCLEDVDQPADTSLDDAAVVAKAEPRTLPRHELPGIGETVPIELDGVQRHAPAGRGLPYFAQPPESTASAVVLRAIPYFQWANRGDGAMRVWIPVTD